jgi:hypothetical protein
VIYQLVYSLARPMQLDGEGGFRYSNAHRRVGVGELVNLGCNPAPSLKLSQFGEGICQDQFLFADLGKLQRSQRTLICDSNFDAAIVTDSLDGRVNEVSRTLELSMPPAAVLERIPQVRLERAL